MYRADFDKFLESEEFREAERDPAYNRLRDILALYFEMRVFLDVEALLHEEIYQKLELGFRHGFLCGQMAERKKKRKNKE